MSDINKRRARKSKLVPRDYVDIEDDKNKMKEPSEKMPKIFLKSLDNLMGSSSTGSSIQFNVQVEVESYEGEDNLIIDESYFNEVTDQNNDDGTTDWAIKESETNYKDSLAAGDDDESLTEYMKFLTARTQNMPVVPTSTTSKLTTDEIINKTDDLMKNADNIVDKILSVEVKNMWGRLRHTPNKQDKHEILIQEALDSWMKLFHSKLNDPPMFYKCYICEKAWWDLYDFREHIRNHNSRTLNVDIEAFNEQCCIGAYVKKPDENQQFSIDSDCWRCGKDFDSHLKPYYECGGCMLHFNSCLMLSEHEGSCLSYWYEKNYDNRDKQDIDVHQCPLCVKRLFSSYSLMMKHMLAYHTVRSDRCTLVKTAICAKCDNKYAAFFTHYCRSKCGTMFCTDCDRRFSTKYILDLHQRVNKKSVTCKVCDVSLETQCKEAHHMLTHTENFIEAVRCTLCYEQYAMNTLFVKRNSEDMREHLKQSHKTRKIDSKVRVYDSVIIPANLAQIKGSEIVKVEAVREVETKEKTTTKRGTRKPSIIRKRKIKVNEPKKVPNDSSTVLTTHIMNNITQHIVKYTAICKTNKDKQNDSDSGIKIGKFFSNFNVNDEINLDNENATMEVFEHTTSNNCNNKHNKQTNNDINATISNTDIVIKQEINTDDNNIDENKQIDNITDIIENAQVNIGIRQTNSDNGNKPNELVNTNNEINTDIDSNIKIKDEVLDDEYEDPVNYDITIEETDISLSKVFSVSDSLKEFASKITVKEELNEDNQEFEDNSKDNKKIKDEFNADMLKNAEFQEMDDSNKIKPLLVKAETSKSEVYFCVCGDFKGTLSEFQEHEVFCDNPEIKTYRTPKKLIYTCVTCKFKGTYGEFKNHERRCDNPQKLKPYESHYCSKCKKDFGRIKDYVDHLKLHGVKARSCPECCMQFGRYLDLKHHLETHIRSLFLIGTVNKNFKKRQRTFQCKLCLKKFKTAQFFGHWEKHLKIKVDSIDSTETKTSSKPKPKTEKDVAVCEFKVLETDILKAAIEFLQSKRCRIKYCLVCQRAFDRHNGVKRHLVEHLLNDAYLTRQRNDALTCQICGDMLHGAARYKVHMRNHAGLRVYKCEMCNKYFSDSSNFTKHKKVHNIDAFTCDLCRKKFQKKASIIRHMEDHNRQPEPLICTKCVTEKFFYDKTKYKKHMKTAHSGIASQFSCKVCKEKFPSVREKWNHEWEVHRERKVVSDCPICKASFRRYTDVKQHMKKMHNKEWTQLSRSFKSVFLNTRIEGVLEQSELFISNEPQETFIIYE